MRITVGEGRRIESHLAQQIVRARPCFHRRNAVHLRAKCNRVFDGEARIERGVAVLKHHLHPAAQLPQRQIAAELFAVEHDRAGIRLDQADHQPRRRRLAAAGFADDAEHLALVDREAHVIDRAHHAAPPEQAAAELEVLAQCAHLEQRLLRAADVGDRRERFRLGHPWRSACRR